MLESRVRKNEAFRVRYEGLMESIKYIKIYPSTPVVNYCKLLIGKQPNISERHPITVEL